MGIYQLGDYRIHLSDAYLVDYKPSQASLFLPDDATMIKWTDGGRLRIRSRGMVSYEPSGYDLFLYFYEEAEEKWFSDMRTER